MRTVRDIAEVCLDYTDLDEAEDLLASASTRQKKALAGIITGALQSLHAKKPTAFKQRVGWTLEAPASIQAIVTAGSTGIVLPSGRDYRGLMVRSGGIRNQIAPAAVSPGNNLLAPWRGSSGEQTFTVYGDAFPVGSSAFTVIGDVHVEGYGPIRPLPDRNAYIGYLDELWSGDYNHRPPSLSSSRWTGAPEAWWAETAYLAGSRGQLYLRFAPLPDRAYTVTFDLGFVPQELTDEDLEDESIVLPIPGDFYDAILTPTVLQRWTGTPWFRSNDSKPEIARQFREAENMLMDWGGQIEQGSEFNVEIL